MIPVPTVHSSLAFVLCALAGHLFGYEAALAIDAQAFGGWSRSVGYWVHPAFTGRGFATRAAQALTTLGLSLPGVTHIEIHHDKANVASGRVPFKLGFEMVGEQAVKAAAPGETGLSCVWRVDHASWAVKATGSGRGRAITTGRPESARLSPHD